MEHWAKHFRHYDFFMNEFSAYKDTVNLHVSELKNAKHILDDGCGTGNLSFKLLKAGHKVSAIDPSVSAISITKAKCLHYSSNLDARIMDGEHLLYEKNTFDGISSVFVIPFVKDQKKYISEMFRVANPGCKIVISTWSNEKSLVFDIMQTMVEEYKEKGILPKHNDEWLEFIETTKINKQTLDLRQETEPLYSALANAGFSVIKQHSMNPYGTSALFITCQKPIKWPPSHI